MVRTTADETRISSWHLPADHLPASRPVALFFHGNGENLETMRQTGLFGELAGLQIGFAAVDYPGYGRSGGRASEESLGFPFSGRSPKCNNASTCFRGSSKWIATVDPTAVTSCSLWRVM